MIANSDNQLQIVIPLDSLQQLYAYQKGILALLNTIEMGECSERKKKDLHRVYELLGHLYEANEKAPTRTQQDTFLS